MHPGQLRDSRLEDAVMICSLVSLACSSGVQGSLQAALVGLVV